MKRISILLVLTIISAQSFGQWRNDYLGIGIGAAVPVGAFGATNSNYYNKAGYATTGASFNVNYYHRFDDWFGLAVSSFSASNSVNTGRLLDVTQYAGMDVNRYSNANCLLVGGILKKRDFPLYAKAQIGIGEVQTAEFRFYDYGGYEQQAFLQSDPAFGFAYSLGVGGLFPLRHGWALTLSADYVSCLAKPTVTTLDNGGVEYNNPALSYGQNFVNLQVGLGYTFGQPMHRKPKERPMPRY